MKKQTLIIIIFAIVLVAVVLFFVLRKGSSEDNAKSSTPTNINDCSNWKAKEAIQKGLRIDPTWIKKHDIDDCTILQWMYHIKYESSWGRDKSGRALFEDAVYQAHKAGN